MAVTLVAAATVVAGSIQATDGERAILHRHRPVLVYDRQEKWRAVGVERFVGRGLRPDRAEEPTPPGVRDVIYGRAVRNGGRTWLQYWVFFSYNGQDRGIVRTGRHEGDWELFQLGLGHDRRPSVATFSQHSSAAGCGWSELELEAGRPRVYVANASHALYPRRGVHDRPFPDPNDEARGGVEATPDLRQVSDASPEWMRLDGRWGGSSGGLVPGEQASPRGPAFSGERWTRPAEFHAGARGCFTAPGGARWAAPVIGGAAMAAGFLGAVLWRRGRRDQRGPRVTLGA